VNRKLDGEEEVQCERSGHFLWFDDKAEEASNFYVSIFNNSQLGSITRGGHILRCEL
jgi:predicted 3-demethylubiquinone-9 3-methyltransferase (glyoxalase superfamily)